MKRFIRLFTELDESNSTLKKVAALESYFREAKPENAAWALWFLTGNRFKSSVRTGMLRQWASDLSGIPLWLVEESYDAVGDLAETIALLLPEPESTSDMPLHQLVKDYVEPLRLWDDPIKFNILKDIWSQLNARERFVYNKLITGAFRVGASKTLVIRALSQVAEIEPAVMAHRLMGNWEPTAESFQHLLAEEDQFDDPARPYPFYLAYPLEDKAKLNTQETLGNIDDWQIEWKWDGIRAQLIRRSGQSLIWSRGEEMMTDRFPEIATAADFLPDGTVLDGEILAWKNNHPMPFGDMQKRIGRKKLTPAILKETPVVFMAYDCLEYNGQDLRPQPLSIRLEALQTILTAQPDDFAIRPSPAVEADDWPQLIRMLDESRERGVEGFMLKQKGSEYKTGRVKGDWWKWKIDPLTMDAVMIYAQSGHGRRAGLYTDYTFAVWSGEELVPVAKAYSGLTDAEIRKVDNFIRRNTTDKFGPVRVVKPLKVFELAFEGIQRSTRHKSGIAVRFPRISRIRDDKKPEEADTLETLEGLLG